MKQPESHPRRRIKPPDDYPTHGLCQCNCEGVAPIAPHTDVTRGWYVGLPIRFIRGHWQPPRGPDSPGFRGRQIRNGYVLVYAPDHPEALKSPRSRAGYVNEHRLVWEQTHGRRLKPNESVHHINGDRADNRPENLVALSKSEHQRLHQATSIYTEDTRKKLSESTRRAWAEGRMKRTG